MLNNKNKNYDDGDIIVSGYADIWNKNYKAKKARNHILQYGLLAMLEYYSTPTTFYLQSCFNTPNVMQVGTDISTASYFNMSALVSPLTSSSSITYPNSATVSYSQPSGTTQWQAVIAATWNASALPNATIGEVGLYGNNLRVVGTSYNYVLTRIASADGSFTAFTNNNTYPLSINYVINFKYQ